MTFLISLACLALGAVVFYVLRRRHHSALAAQISARQHAEEQLRTYLTERQRADEKFRMLLESAPDAMLIVNKEGNIVLVNSQTEKLFGYTRQELLGKPAEILVPERFRDVGGAAKQSSGYYARPQLRARPEKKELFGLRKDGTECPIEVNLRPLETEEGVLFCSSLRDITQRKQVEAELARHTEELARSEEAYRRQTKILRSILDSISDGVVVANEKGKFLFINPAAEEYLGVNRADQVTDSWTKRSGLFLPDRTTPYPLHQLPLMRSIQGEAVDGDEIFVRHPRAPSGLWVSANARPLKDDQGKAQGGVVVFRDITAQKQVEEKLRQSEERFRLLVEGVKEYAIFWLSPEGRVVSWNSSAERIKGYRAEEILGKHFACFYPPDEIAAGQPERNLRQAVAEGRVEDEGWRVRRDGSRFWADVIITAVYDESGQLRGFAKVTRDITERKRAEEALREGQRLSQSIIDTAHEAFVAIDARGLVIDWNHQAEQTFGWSHEEALGRPVAELLIPPEHREAHRRGIERFLATGEGPVLNKRIELTAVHRQGHRFAVELTIAPLALGQEYRFNAFIHDISERKQSEEKLRTFAAQLERSNRDLQDFASVASHDLQEPLRKIQAFGDRLQSRCTEALDEQGRDYLQRMLGAAGRMQNLINDLLAYSRVASKAQPFHKVDLAQVAREVVSDLEARLAQTGGRVEVGELPTIEADPVQMRQLMQNLIGNALKFHQLNVAPVIRLEGQLLAGPRWSTDGNGGPPAFCEIRVCDNGIGFEEKYRDRLFHVFQRLHGRGEYEGTGMGLAICRRIVERHGGGITAQSTPGQGSTFIVTLPLAQVAQVAQVAHSKGEKVR
jgi:PAS domain S-box-containing protein